jgi:CheY-like chemotaxis protein
MQIHHRETPMNTYLHIYLVEDDADLRELAMLAITSRRRNGVEMAKDGLEAWERLSDDRLSCDVIVTDNDMPRMGGLELLQKLRSDPRFEKIPVVVYSSNTSEQLKLDVEVWNGIFVPKKLSHDNLLEVLDRIAAQ